MHKVVMEVNVESDEAWQAISSNLENLQKALGAGGLALEVVAHGKGLNYLLINSPLATRLFALADAGLVFAACENTMRRRNLRREDLLPFVITVPAGVAEVVLKQEAGYAYLKGGF